MSKPKTKRSKSKPTAGAVDNLDSVLAEEERETRAALKSYAENADGETKTIVRLACAPDDAWSDASTELERIAGEVLPELTDEDRRAAAEAGAAAFREAISEHVDRIQLKRLRDC